MDKASRHPNGARTNMQQPQTITALFAEAAMHKMIWASTSPRSRYFESHLAEGAALEDQIIALPARSREDIALKATLLLDWLEESLAPAPKALLRSIIADLQGRAPDEPAINLPAAPPPKPLTAGAKVRAHRNLETQKRVPNVRIDRRARPCIVDGIPFPSIIAAAKALNLSCDDIVRLAARN